MNWKVAYLTPKQETLLETIPGLAYFKIYFDPLGQLYLRKYDNIHF